MPEGTTMGEERAQILEILMAGRVTVEQADQLLQALDVSSSRAHDGATSEAGTQRRREERPEDFFASLTAEQLVALRDSGVSRAYVGQMRSAGLNELHVEDLIELHDNGVTPRFVRDLREAGLADLTLDQLIELFCHGVNADYVCEMHALGLTGATPDQLVELYDHGVDAAFVREMRGHGYTDLTPSRWVALRDNGVEDDDTGNQGEWQ
jgi:hypothetical protein